MRGLLVAFLLLDASTGIALSGRVVDAQDLAIPGAAVHIVCGGQVVDARTDRSGSFAVELDAAIEACVVDVTHDGFTAETTALSAEAISKPVVVRLALAPLQASVIVTAETPETTHRALQGIALSAELLQRHFARTEDMVRFASLVAGHPASTVVQVDGLPVSVMPPAAVVRRIDVSPGQFSAEHGTGDATFVNVVTGAPARGLAFSTGATIAAFGGGDASRDGLSAGSAARHLAMSFPVPHLPLSVFTDAQWSSDTNEIAFHVDASSGEQLRLGATAPTTPVSYSRSVRSGTVAAYFTPSPALRAHIAIAPSRAHASNVGVGGIVLPSAGLMTDSRSDGVQLSLQATGGSRTFESGFSARTSASSSRANSEGPGYTVPGGFVSGGAVVLAQESSRRVWSSKHMLRSLGGRPWTAGVSVSGSSTRTARTPNPAGIFQIAPLAGLDRAGAAPAPVTWFLEAGDAVASRRNLAVAPFVQTSLVRRARFQMDAGVRVDYQHGVGLATSPRVSASYALAGFNFQGGVGLFAQNIPDAVFEKLAQRTPDRISTCPDVTVLSECARLDDAAAAQTIRTALADETTHTRQLVRHVTAGRRFRFVTPSVDYTATREWHRLGATRATPADGWVDTIAGDRAMTRHRVSAGLQLTWARQFVSVRHEWIRAFDNADGPFSYPERSSELAREWARSAGLSPRYTIIVASLALPLAVDAAVTDVWQSAAPFNVTTAGDEDQNGLFNERGGLARNSGWSPSQHLMSLRFSRPFTLAIPRTWFKGRVRTIVGLEVDNATNRLNATAIGNIVGTPGFGQPLGAGPGRSARITLRFQ